MRVGRSVSCGRPLALRPAVDNPHPALHLMIRGGDEYVLPGVGLEAMMDFVGIALHGIATTHIDALCHLLHPSCLNPRLPEGRALRDGRPVASAAGRNHGAAERRYAANTKAGMTTSQASAARVSAYSGWVSPRLRQTMAATDAATRSTSGGDV